MWLLRAQVATGVLHAAAVVEIAKAAPKLTLLLKGLAVGGTGLASAVGLPVVLPLEMALFLRAGGGVLLDGPSEEE
eukprot:CAMPEP_0183387234 /NCGR_PEP_ID=MMETSP0370-20130417/3023_1 /TAXON_ID=268820 /ORGANISM="Peridinium aciculiferum, Strain PAER-2" /LENGTH=75 /DNA_ID=CAMNT_0025565767 /DNA_START=98 /DNA_END=325 /DNA_ORIENTATION=+